MKTLKVSLAMIAVVASLFLTKSNMLASDLDNRIESSAKQSYVFKTYLKGDDIDIQSKDEAVTLTGTVSDESHKKLARDTVASLPGVKSVDSKLEVKGQIPAEYSDAWLIAKVKVTLFFHKNVNAIETEVSAKDGDVILSGHAYSAAQKNLTTEYAMDVDGVKNVKNEMTVSTAAVTQSEKTMGEKMNAIGDSIDDASITALVEATLLYHRSTRDLKATVETKDGLVTLGGKAKNGAEKDLAAKLVSDVFGVKKVVNNMTVGGTTS